MKYLLRRLFFILITLTSVTSFGYAQSAYTLHTIESGESLSGLAKTYHTTVGDIMRMNAMHSDSKLVIGAKIKIPASSSPAPATPAKTVASPVTKKTLTHTVQSGESLYHISQTYKIPVKTLITLNRLDNTGDIKVGQVLKVGDGSAAAPAKSRTTPTVADSSQHTSAASKPVELPQTVPPAVVNDNKTVTSTTTTSIEKPVVAQPQTMQPVTSTSDKAITTPVVQPVVSTAFVPAGEGFFSSQFRQNVEGRNEQTKTGASMTFKSASGWADKKFYVLMNNAPPGSIVKLANGNNIVYAKVLWSLGAQKENEGLDFRISTAAAAALNITDEKFNLTITYFQ